jgi:hypothetical protein
MHEFYHGQRGEGCRTPKAHSFLRQSPLIATSVEKPPDEIEPSENEERHGNHEGQQLTNTYPTHRSNCSSFKKKSQKRRQDQYSGKPAGLDPNVDRVREKATLRSSGDFLFTGNLCRGDAFIEWIGVQSNRSPPKIASAPDRLVAVRLEGSEREKKQTASWKKDSPVNPHAELDT